MVAMVGPALGPTLGGYVTTALSWHWLFLINVPLGLVTVLAGLRIMPRFPTQVGASLDAWGIVLATSGLSAAVLGLSEARRWGWRSTPTLLALAAGAVLLTCFVIHVLHTDAPIFDIRIFRVRSFGLAMLITFGYLIGQTARLVFLPLQLQTLQGLSSLRVGVLFVPAVACQALAFPISGRISDRLGRRVPIMLGTAVATIGLLCLARQTTATPIAIVVGFVAMQAIGSGLCGPPTMAAVGDLSGPSVPHGSAARALIQQVSGVAAVAGLGALVDGGMGAESAPEEIQSAYNLAYAGAAVCAFAAFLLATRLARGSSERPAETPTDDLALATT
jgi:MFS family permease